jgi:hypothetical protein
MTTKKLFFAMFGLSIIILIGGCVQTKVTSLKDPTYNGKTFSRILVVADFENNESIIAFETAMVRELEKKGITAFANHKVLPNIRTYTDEERKEIYDKYNYECIIIIVPKGYNTATVNMPTWSSTYSSKRIKQRNNGDQTTGSSTTTTFKGGERPQVMSVNLGNVRKFV